MLKGDLEKYLIETNGVKSQAEIEKSNGNSIQNTKTHYSFEVDWFAFKEIKAQCHMKTAVCHH